MKFRTITMLILTILLIGSAGCIDPPTPKLVPIEGDTYTDLDGLFSVPIPTNWHAAQSYKGYGILTSPEEDLIVYVMAVEAESVEEGVRMAWDIIDPTFALEPDEVVELPARNGADVAINITYDTGTEDEVIMAGGWTYEDFAYIEIITTDLITLQKRISQLQIIDTGYTISALAPVDLSKVKPIPFSDELLAKLETYIVDSMELFDVPGLAIAIVKDGEIVYAEGFGVRELGSDEPVTPETLMLIGSTTKTMTTLLMAQLVDAGLMDWDTPVVDIMPEFAVADPEITRTITMQNMVCACTGVPRRDFELIFNAHELSAEDIIESLADFEFFTGFGEAFQYSNQMVATGGYLAALAAGGGYGKLYEDYLTLMQENIFDPIGMNNTTFSFDEAIESGNYAIPHASNLVMEYSSITLGEEESFLAPIVPAGGAWSNVMDMALYLVTELNTGVTLDGERIVSTENLAKTWEPQIAITNDMSYGLGWIVGDYKGTSVIEHAGNTLGFSSEMVFLPEANLGIIILANQQGSVANQMVRMRLLELLYQQEPEIDELVQSYLDMLESQISELSEKLEESVDPEPVEPYLGRYSNPALGNITSEWRDGKLVFDADEFQAEVRSLVREDGGIAYFLYDSAFAGLSLEPGVDEDGNLILIIGAGVNEYTFTKVE